MEHNSLTLAAALLLQGVIVLGLVAAHSGYALQIVDRATGLPTGEVCPVWPLPALLWRPGFCGFARAGRMAVRVEVSQDGRVSMRVSDPRALRDATLQYCDLRVGQSAPLTLDCDVMLLKIEGRPERANASTAVITPH